MIQKRRCLLCPTPIPFDFSIPEETVESMTRKRVPWKVMKASLDRRLCGPCRKKAKDEGPYIGATEKK